MGDLDGKVAIVTGGAAGIGRAMVERFVAEGARVVIADVDADTGLEVASSLGDAAAFQATDVTVADEVQAAVDATVERFGGLHVLVNNAGLGGAMARFLHDDLADFHRIVDVNLLGMLVGSQRAARHMKEHGGGSIVNVSSTAGINAGAGLIAYRSMKAAVIHASRNIAIEVAQYGIRVNCIVPGQIATAMNEGSYDLDHVMQLTQPLPRAGRPDDVAEAALFLASDRSAQITGVTLPVDGGTTTGPPAALLKILLQRTQPTEG